ncbi:MAG TPA: PDZ domain-containing protein [Bryobacteraceae bacterium]|nr:PDZ domain-containing protein [Bryobacteraceae bacterium]HPT26312.1 PDZ domain-containing protein [Bryobacteraceae bacterium]
MSIRRILAISALGILPLCAQDAPAPPTPPAPPQVYAFKASGSFLGVGVREVDSERAKALNLPAEYGVEVTKVDESSPAEKAGLKVGDVVQSYNGQRVEGTEQFVRMVRETPAGRTAQLGLVRNGAQQTLSATIASRKASNVFVTEGKSWSIPNMERNFEFSMPDMPKATMSWRSSMLGVEGESLSESQLASFFGVKEGVLVRSVIKDTAAEKAGIKAGDVIVKIDSETIDAPRDITAALRAARKEGKKTISVSLYRDRKEMPLTVTLDDETSSTPRPRGSRVTVRKDEL